MMFRPVPGGITETTITSLWRNGLPSRSSLKLRQAKRSKAAATRSIIAFQGRRSGLPLLFQLLRLQAERLRPQKINLRRSVRRLPQMHHDVIQLLLESAGAL